MTTSSSSHSPPNLIPTTTTRLDCDNAVHNLEHNDDGISILHLPPTLSHRLAHAFHIFRSTMERIHSHPHDISSCRIPPGANAATVTGYHHPSTMSSSLSRYNRHREGFVFSNGDVIKGLSLLDETMQREMFDVLFHEIGLEIVAALERRLRLEEGWFEREMGPMGLWSQWHVKRYVTVSSEEKCDDGELLRGEETTTKTTGSNDDEPTILLPMHTDPSLLSIVIHDEPGINPGAKGLQHLSRTSPSEKKTWREVSHHGHGIATVIVGSLLSLLTGGMYTAARHRVVATGDDEERERMAVTLFLRPRRDALLRVPPSEVLRGVRIKKKWTVAQWSDKVARNYSKGRKKAG